MGRVGQGVATPKYKFLLFCLFVVAYLFFYILPNFRPFLPPSLLPRLSLDYLVPLVPWSFLVYVSDYVLVASVTLWLTEIEEFNSFVRMMFFSLIVCGTFFLAFPTTYPRPEYPAVANSLVGFAMYLVHEFDTPNNCFPSMHVALTGVATWAIRTRGARVFLWYLVWALAVFLSTLTTKQHYFLDVIGGVAVVVTAAAFDWFVAYRSLIRERFQKAFLFHKG